MLDLDSEKVFDQVNHNRLMASVAKRVADKRMLKLIRAFLEAGVMESGLVSPADEGAPPGGPLAPLTFQPAAGPWVGSAVKPQRMLTREVKPTASPNCEHPSHRFVGGLTYRTAVCGTACPVVWRVVSR